MSGLATALSVLMIGHSLFGPTAPAMLDEALKTGTGHGTVAAQIINGAPLQYNWDNAADAEGVNAREVLPQGGVTDLVLTEAIPLANHVQWSNTVTNALNFARLAETANPGVRIYVQETWHSLKSGTGQPVEYDGGADTPWRQRLDQDLPVWQGLVDGIAAGLTSDTVTVSLIPAGQALALLHDEIAAGEVEGLSDISALFDDDIHLNDLGHYFVTMVQYAVITGNDPLGLTRHFSNRFGQPFDTPDEDLARALQRVAWRAVQGYLPPERSAAAPRPSVESPAVPRAPPATPLPVLTTASEDAVSGTKAMAIGLASVTDWSTQQPFLDLMKTARPWIGHLPGQWGGVDHAELVAEGLIDANGWPVEVPRSLGSIGTLILTDMPAEATSLEGRYRVAFDGQGVVEVLGRAANVRYGRGEVRFDYTPGPGPVELRIQRSNRSDPVRNITVVREDHIAAFEGGAIFSPDWTARLAPFKALRFMDWAETNNSELARWQDRPEPSDATFAPGVPLEVMIALGNSLQKDIWLNVPHLAEDAFVQAMAELVRDRLDPGLRVYLEFSNEVWNWQFAQARWADEMARARWGAADRWMQYHGLRAAQVARIWSGVFGAQAERRLINVVSSQTGWLGLEAEVLEAPLAVAEGQTPPATAFDAYAITGYFGGVLGLEDRAAMVRGWLAESAAQARAEAEAQGLTGQAAADYERAHRYDFASALAGRDLTDGAVSGNPEDTLADLLGRVWPHHAAIARQNGLDLIMYEGGSHATGIGPMVDDAEITAFLQHFNYSVEMGALYETLMEGWLAVGGQLFTHYSDVYAPTKWGAWGALRHLDDSNPRWDALVAWQ